MPIETEPAGGPAPHGDPGLEDRLRRLTTLLEVSRLLTSELDLSEIVHQVLTSAIAVIPAADVGTLYLVDATSGKLAATDTVGFGPSIFQLKLEPGEGAAGRAVLSGHGEILPDLDAIHAALSDASPDTYRHFRDASRGFRSLVAAMTAPLVFKGKILGALVVDALHHEHAFMEADLGMLEDFAQIAAIAIVNARLYGSEHTSRIRLEVLNDEITRQRDQLDRRLRAFDSMSQIAREGLGLPALAGRLAALCSARSYVLDGLARVRAAEPAGSRDREALERLDSPEFAKLLQRVTHDQQRHSSVGDRQLVVSPIVAGAELLGYVALDATEVESADLNEALADMAALIASTVFVQERALEEGDVRRRTDLLQRLLEGDVPKSAASFRALPPPWRLAVGQVCPPTPNSHEVASKPNILRELRMVSEQVLRGEQMAAVPAPRSDSVVLAWSGQAAGTYTRVRDRLEVISDAIREATAWNVVFAVTEALTDP